MDRDPWIRQTPWYFSVLAVAIVVLLGAGVSLLFRKEGPVFDAAGDLSYSAPSGSAGSTGSSSQLSATEADIVAAEVARSDDALELRAHMARAWPRALDPSALVLEWTLSNGDGTWVARARLSSSLSATLERDGRPPAATIVARPKGRAVTLVITPPDALPDGFDWSVRTRLLAFGDEPGSASVQDRLPDHGSVDQ